MAAHKVIEVDLVTGEPPAVRGCMHLDGQMVGPIDRSTAETGFRAAAGPEPGIPSVMRSARLTQGVARRLAASPVARRTRYASQHDEDEDRLRGDARAVPPHGTHRLVRPGRIRWLRGRLHGERALSPLDAASGQRRVRLVVHGSTGP